MERNEQCVYSGREKEKKEEKVVFIFRFNQFSRR